MLKRVLRLIVQVNRVVASLISNGELEVFAYDLFLVDIDYCLDVLGAERLIVILLVN